MQLDPDRPVLIDKYLDRADELDVDALCDKDGNVVITGIMQHIEQARPHSLSSPFAQPAARGCPTALRRTRHEAASRRQSVLSFLRG